MDTIDAEFEIIESTGGISMSVFQQPQQPPSVNLGGSEDGGQDGPGGSDPTCTQSKKRARARSAACWTSNWFIFIDGKDSRDGKAKAQCTKCKQLFMADPTKNGTTSLNNHMKKCPRRDNKDINQMLMQKSGGTLAIRDLKIDPDVVREMILTLVVKNELPLRFIEYEEFRKLMLYVYPSYTPISRGTLLNDIHKLFKKEKMNIREAVKSSAGRISVTTDLWTSISNDGYMSLTAHYIDRSWVLHKRLIKFTTLTLPHSGAHICETINKILVEWGLEGRLFSVTVDNASANDVFVSYLKTNLNAKNALACKGEFFHIRCCAHVLNLIVQDGIKLIDKSVQKIRDSVKFIKSSQARKVRFAESCEHMGLNTKRGLHGDVTIRWNSTFQMLDDALFYKQAFVNLENLDTNYTDYPTHEEWLKIEKLTDFLRPFDGITKVLSGSKYPTSNLYFRSVVEVHMVLEDGFLFGADFMMEMVSSMREKFNKYWEKYSLILSIAAVLDPRYKLEVLEWAYEKIHHGENFLINEAINRVKSALGRLYGEYKSMPKEQWSSTSTYESFDPSTEDPFASWAKRKKSITNEKSELDQYLEEPRKLWVKDYDVLAYWKGCEIQFHDLSRLARDILAIPVSTVASESAFSAGGRVINKYRSRLLPRNVEALVCLRDWMYNVNFGAENEMDLDQDGEELADALRDVFAIPPAPSLAFTTTTGTTNTVVD